MEVCTAETRPLSGETKRLYSRGGGSAAGGGRAEGCVVGLSRDVDLIAVRPVVDDVHPADRFALPIQWLIFARDKRPVKTRIVRSVQSRTVSSLHRITLPSSEDGRSALAQTIWIEIEAEHAPGPPPPPQLLPPPHVRIVVSACSMVVLYLRGTL